jgi:hypothetical protein
VLSANKVKKQIKIEIGTQRMSARDGKSDVLLLQMPA